MTHFIKDLKEETKWLSEPTEDIVESFVEAIDEQLWELTDVVDPINRATLLLYDRVDFRSNDLGDDAETQVYEVALIIMLALTVDGCTTKYLATSKYTKYVTAAGERNDDDAEYEVAHNTEVSKMGGDHE